MIHFQIAKSGLRKSQSLNGECRPVRTLSGVLCEWFKKIHTGASAWLVGVSSISFPISLIHYQESVHRPHYRKTSPYTQRYTVETAKAPSASAQVKQLASKHHAAASLRCLRYRAIISACIPLHLSQQNDSFFP